MHLEPAKMLKKITFTQKQKPVRIYAKQTKTIVW